MIKAAIIHRRSLSFYKITAVGLVAALLFGLIFFPGCSSSEGTQGTKVGNLAPNFELVDLDGNQIKLSDLSGKAVFLNFWASWCPSCIAEMPYIEAIHQKYKDQDVVVIGINLRETADTIRKFTQKNGYSWTFVLDKTGLVGNTYQVDGLPASYFLDTRGIIRSVKIGPISQAVMESSLASARSWK